MGVKPVFRLYRLAHNLHFRGYRQLWLGSMIAQVAFRMQDVILGWQMLEVTNSAFWVGVVGFTHGVPLLIWSPLTGVIVDRMSRQRVLAASGVLAAACTGGLVFWTARGSALPWQTAMTSFLVGSMFTLYSPARLALLPSLVPPEMVPSASMLEYSSTRLMGFLGPVLAGLAVAGLGLAPGIALTMGFFLLATVAFLFIGGPDGAVEGRPSGSLQVWRAVGEALAYLRTDRPLLLLLMLGLVVVPFGMSYVRLIPVFTRDVLGEGVSAVGWLVGLSSLGTGVIGLVIATVASQYNRGLAVGCSAIAFGCGLTALMLSQEVAVAFALSFMLGLIIGVYLTVCHVVFQTRAPDALRGRVISAWGMVWGIAPFADLAMGALAAKWGVVPVVIGSGLICASFAAALLVLAPELKRL